MDSKKLAKLIKVIVEAEVAKKQEQFLSKTFPKILEEEVNRRVKKALNEAKGGVSSSPVVEQEIDPFAQAEAVLQQERVQQVQEQRQYTNNPVLNQVLNQTQPFTSAQRNGGQVGGGNASVLDSFQTQQPQVQESYDQTVSFNSQGAQMGVGGMRTQMAAQMGYGDVPGVGVKKTGLGVQTGLPGLDRILNRDNSELVKKFKR
jgi:hypothetical protein